MESQLCLWGMGPSDVVSQSSPWFPYTLYTLLPFFLKKKIIIVKLLEPSKLCVCIYKGKKKGFKNEYALKSRDKTSY